MKRIYVIYDAAGWMSDYYFTSHREAKEFSMRLVKDAPGIYTSPLSIRAFTAF